MTRDRFASLFYAGAEHVTRGNVLVYTLHFKCPLELARVRASYERWVRARESLRLCFVEYAHTRAFGWEPFDDTDLEALLDKERSALSRYTRRELLDQAYHPLNTRLPFRLAMVDDCTLVCSVHRAWSDVHGGLAWLSDFLRVYHAKVGAPVPAPAEPGREGRGLLRRLRAAVSAVLWTLLFALKSFAATHKGRAAALVDFTHGKKVTRHQRGYTVRRFDFSSEQSARIVQDARARKLSVDEWVALSVVETLFAAQPDRDCVSMSLPASHVEAASRGSNAGAKGSVSVHFFRARPLEAQVREAFSWPKRGVVGWRAQRSLLAENEVALGEQLAQREQQACAERSPYGAESCAWLSVHASLPELAAELSRISVHAKSQTLSFTAAAVQGVLSLECCFANDLFDADEMLAMLDELPRRLGVSAMPRPLSRDLDETRPQRLLRQAAI